MASKPILYSFYRSSCAWRVRIALALKKIEYEYRPVDIFKGQQNSEEFSKLNPLSQVPALVCNGATVVQSMAIIGFLDDVYPKPPLYPKDPIQKAQAHALAEIINSGTQPMQNLSVLKRLCTDPEKQKEWSHYWIDKGLTAFEKMLQQTAGKYCVGNSVSIADICLVPQMLNAHRADVDFTKFPLIQKITVSLSEMDAFKEADPFIQPDCPKELQGKGKKY
ncbi:hypothetical protein ACJMK2_036729 [Sinanodonta woodiana]|uniref:maleylacetoacetate isomerase n=1 Tax=Sinanodonta woodiana TaxID=1069815 RepID=A0ABD3WI37_SINWO